MGFMCLFEGGGEVSDLAQKMVVKCLPLTTFNGHTPEAKDSDEKCSFL